MKSNTAIIYPILKEHERRGIYSAIGGRIPISKVEVKETMHALKIFLVSMGGSSRDARKFYKNNYVICDDWQCRPRGLCQSHSILK